MTEKGKLRGQVAVVSGGSGAIGRAVVAGLVDNGVRAVSLDLTDPGDRIPWVRCDIRDEEARAAVVDARQDVRCRDVERGPRWPCVPLHAGVG